MQNNLFELFFPITVLEDTGESGNLVHYWTFPLLSLNSVVNYDYDLFLFACHQVSRYVCFLKLMSCFQIINRSSRSSKTSKNSQTTTMTAPGNCKCLYHIVLVVINCKKPITCTFKHFCVF